MCMKTGLNRNQSRAAISAREVFSNSTGSLTGVEIVHPYVDRGMLNADESARLNDDLPDISYVVFSYSTPIMWIKRDGTVYKVAQKFSMTTSHHMGMCS